MDRPGVVLGWIISVGGIASSVAAHDRALGILMNCSPCNSQLPMSWACVLISGGIAYTLLRGLVSLVAFARWTARTWYALGLRAQEDRAAQPITRGRLSPAWNPVYVRRSRLHTLEYCELILFVVFFVVLLLWLRGCDACYQATAAGTSCFASIGSFVAGPYLAIVISYVFRWDSQALAARGR